MIMTAIKLRSYKANFIPSATAVPNRIHCIVFRLNALDDYPKDGGSGVV